MRSIKIKHKKFLIIGAVMVICVGAAGIFFFKRSGAGRETAVKVQEATVEKGTISNTIVGTGNLELNASSAVQIPSGVTVKETKAESGDAVSKGDVLATVDKSSVIEALAEVQEAIDSIDEQINDCKNGDDTETVKATVSGTVQKINAKKGDSVTDRIAEDGSLLIISASDTGDKLEVTAGSGTISKVHVSKGQSVSSGTTLFTITNDENSEKYEALLSERKELTKTVKKLAQMAKTGELTADEDGVVVDVNVTGGSSGTSDSGNTSGSSQASTTNMSFTKSSNGYIGAATDTAYRVVTLAAEENMDASGDNRAETDSGDADDSSLEEKTTELSLSVEGSGSSSASRLVIAVPVTGEKPQNSISVSDGSYSGSVAWSPSVNTFEAETTYRAQVTLTASNGYTFSEGSLAKIATGTLSGISVSGDGKTLSFSVTFPATKSVPKENDSGTGNADESSKTGSTGNDSAVSDKSGSESSGASGSESDGSSFNADGGASRSTKSSVSGGSSSATGTAASSGSSSASESTGSETVSSISEVTAFTLAADDTMLLSVNVDELDINSVAEDQEAEVTLDAIEDSTFTGTVTKVSGSADSTSGSARYAVQISVPKDEQMKAGMNASATIVVEEREDILTLPVNALQEKGNKVFVYTEQDSDGNPAGEVEVSTGLSDGSTVEITEGLSEGDTVYYQKTGVSSGGSSGEMGKGFGDENGFGGSGREGGGRGEMPSGDGEMPFNGGEMPSGGGGKGESR